MQSAMKILMLAIVIIAVLAAPVCAEWPESMELGGFKISNIKGTTNQDGSGKAVGRVMIPGGGSCKVDLTRSASGLVMGSSRASFTVGSVRIDGSFLLDRRGMQGTGTIQTQGLPILDANLVVDPSNGITGSGVVRLGKGIAVRVTCEVSTQGVQAHGTIPCRASIETPLAVYTFNGDVDVSTVGARIRTVAKGSIERTGRIGGMSSSFGPLVFDVDPVSGQAQVNVGGADVNIDLW